MRQPRTQNRRRTRRSILRNGLAATAVTLALPEWLAAAAVDEDGKVRLQSADNVETQQFPWGHIRWLMNGTIDPRAEMTMGVVHFEPNQSNVLHVHPNSAEYLHMLSGSAEHLIDGRWVTLKAGDTLRIPKGVPHQARTKDQAYDALIVYDTPTRIMVPVTDPPPAPGPR
jgi:quercetin dioxygenase-like cupin family protein